MHYQAIVTILLVSFLAGCGNSTESKVESATPPETQSTSNCPLRFEKNGLCASIQWIGNGPSADEASSFRVRFWNRESGSGENGPFSEPSSQVASYVRMTCCGSVHFPTVTTESTGSYLVEGVRLGIGEWEVFVQLKNGEEAESQFVTVKLDE